MERLRLQKIHVQVLLMLSIFAVPFLALEGHRYLFPGQHLGNYSSPITSTIASTTSESSVQTAPSRSTVNTLFPPFTNASPSPTKKATAAAVDAQITSPITPPPIPCAGASFTPQGGAPAKSIPVLLYHGESGAGNTPISIFIDQMCTLKNDGWHTITIEQFVDFMKGRIELPEKSFLLTFDDGRRDTYYSFDPVLAQIGYNAVMYVITGLSMPDSGNPLSFYLNRDELQKMAASGRWKLESHGTDDHVLYDITVPGEPGTRKGHFLSNKFYLTDQNRLESDEEFAARIQKDLSGAKKTLESVFGKPVSTFAYPYSDFGQNTLNFSGAQAIVSRIVPTLYSYAFYQNWPGEGDSYNYPNPNGFMAKRIEPGVDWSGKKLLEYLTIGHVRDLPYHAPPYGSEWAGSWGTITPSGAVLTLDANGEATGAAAFLNGSHLWKNYTYQATIHWKGGSDITLIGRRAAKDDFVACVFGKNRILLEIHRASGQTPIERSGYTFSGDPANVELAMTARGNQIECGINGTTVVSGLISNPEFQQGGIGLQVWDQGKGAAHIEVKDVSVEPLN